MIDLTGVINNIFNHIVNLCTFGWKNRRKSDIERFEKMRSEINLGSDHALLLNDHDFSNSFDNDYLIELNYISSDWKRSDYKIHCWRVNRKKNKFIKSLDAFIGLFEKYSGMDCHGMISVGVNENDKRDKKDKRKLVSDLNKLSSKAYNDLEKYHKKSISIFDL